MKGTLKKLDIERSFLNFINDDYKKPIANIILNGERLNASLLSQKQGKDVFSHYSCST